MNENRVWKEFFLQDVVSIESGKRLTKADMQSGEIPFIGASEMNNGVTTFTGSRNESADFNVLGVNYNGSVGYSFYHPYEAIFSDDVKRVKWLDSTKNNKYTLLFLSSVIKKQKGKFAYGYKFNAQRMKRQKILLPINSEDEIDWAFIEKLMKRIESDILDNALSFFKDRCKYNNLSINKLQQGGVKWSEFYLRDLFPRMEAGKSKGLNHLEKDDLGISYLGATNLNNGVLCFVKAVDNLIQKGNCIAFIRNGEGSMGYSVYKAEDFIATSDMTLAYSEHINKYTGMFITTIADRIRGKYNFGYKRSATRLAKEVLSLPVTDTGQPDWLFMEGYMRNMESRIILRYLERKKSFLEQ